MLGSTWLDLDSSQLGFASLGWLNSIEDKPTWVNLGLT